MIKKLFITGTGTDVGKTYISAGLLRLYARKGFTTLGLKPIASGAYWQEGQLLNTDTLSLRQASTVQIPLSITTPYLFEPAIAPHIAAKKADIKISVDSLVKEIRKAEGYASDFYLIEGVGGWAVPINDQELMSHFVQNLKLPTLLVVGMQLGCLNHALLTVQAILESGLPLIGWVGNCVKENVEELNENIVALKKWLKIPCLGIVPYQGLPEDFIQFELLNF